MNVLPALYAFILFYVLTPNVLVRIPMKGSKYIAAAVHAALFAIVWVVTFRYVGKFEGATTMTPSPMTSKGNTSIPKTLEEGTNDSNGMKKIALDIIVQDITNTFNLMPTNKPDIAPVLEKISKEQSKWYNLIANKFLEEKNPYNAEFKELLKGNYINGVKGHVTLPNPDTTMQTQPTPIK